MKYEVIDNFLDEEYFENLATLFTGSSNVPARINKTKDQISKTYVPWFFTPDITESTLVEDNLFYMVHMFYESNMPTSPHYDILIPLLEKLDAKCLIRIKANLYPNTEILHEHPMHFDYPFSHSSALLSLNTCDGYTKLKDGTKIDSIANRILLLDSSVEHCSTTTTNVSARINININYIHEQDLK